MFIHGFPREAADQVRLRAVGEGERVGHLVEWLGTHWTLTAELLWLVALPIGGRAGVKGHNYCHMTNIKEIF